MAGLPVVTTATAASGRVASWAAGSGRSRLMCGPPTVPLVRALASITASVWPGLQWARPAAARPAQLATTGYGANLPV